MDIKFLKKALLECYSNDLCYCKVQEEWNEDNKYVGMCAITALVVNDYFNGSICKIYIDGISHYFNLINSRVIDLTSKQFKNKLDYSNYQIVTREQLLNNLDTKERYNILKNEIILRLLKNVDKEIYKCNLCNDLVDKFPNAQTVFIGKNIFETTFLESVKCYPLIRNNLKTCSKNCKSIMLNQIDILTPKLIITLGEFPTRNLLNFKFDKFKDVVGNIYEVDGYKVLPIYHPSPISPKGYKDNIPIFEKLKNKIFVEI